MQSVVSLEIPKECLLDFPLEIPRSVDDNILNGASLGGDAYCLCLVFKVSILVACATAARAEGAICK